MFKVEVESVQIANVKGKPKRFGAYAGRRRELEEGLRLLEARPGNQLRAGALIAMALVKVKPTSPGRRALVKVVNARPAQGAADRRGSPRSNEARLRTQQHRPHHHAPPGRRAQAALPHRRFPARQGRHRGQGRAPGVRSEPQRAPRAAAATPMASAATSSLPSGVAAGTQLMSGADAPIKAGNMPAAAQHPGRHDHPLRRDAARQGRADRARSAGASVQLLAREGSVCATAHALGRDPPRARRLPRDHRRAWATRSTTCARSARPAPSAGAASGRRCAAWR